MKKCASCSKDLPEAALHCVFCGAKQAPAPAVPASSVAKTAFGYSANEVMQQLGQQGQQPQQPSYQPPPARGNPGSQPPPVGGYQPPPARGNPGSQPPPVAGGYQPPSPQHAAANAATMFVPGGGPPAQQPYSPPQQYNPPQQQYGNPSPGYGGGGYSPPAPAPYSPPGGGMGIPSPQQPTPAPLPTVQQPYLGANTGVARSSRPIEPWKDALKLMMFVWGGVGLVAFVTPVLTDPAMVFNWDAIIDGEGKQKIPALVWAGVALLSIVFAAIPMMSLPRGALAAVLGIAGIFVPVVVAGDIGDHWQILIQMIGTLFLVPGLLVRHEYTESLLARVLVTIGVVCTLLPYLVPEGGQIPLVLLIKALIEAGSGMEIVIIGLAHIVLAVLCLLVWMPGPATAGAKIFAWAVILFPVAQFLLLVLARGDIGEMISKAPGTLLIWVVGVPGMVGVLYSVLIGYGGATVIGKQLE
ncbi:MAG TPA: DUF3824 domain-containing protein [Kofleriaceae bacterium]